MTDDTAREALRRHLAGEATLPCECGGSLEAHDARSSSEGAHGRVECGSCGDRAFPTAPMHRRGAPVLPRLLGRPPRCPEDATLLVVAAPGIAWCSWCGATNP